VPYDKRIDLIAPCLLKLHWEEGKQWTLHLRRLHKQLTHLFSVPHVYSFSLEAL
jgi:hypothetical protein